VRQVGGPAHDPSALRFSACMIRATAPRSETSADSRNFGPPSSCWYRVVGVEGYGGLPGLRVRCHSGGGAQGAGSD
jgi:hypothetical protein